jgi:hypothetical protein
MTTLNFGLILQTTAEGMEISGQTFHSRERLKALGGTWHPERKLWILPLGTDITSLVRPKPQVIVRPPRRKYLHGDRIWVCPKKEAKLNPVNPQGPMMYVCPCCPTFYSSYDGT